ncbi:MAG: hypothetical protein J5824_01330 [Lachnospiraceae bacterium]|nr:hypothetical protein [Lachnospiraceae bacterium]
MRIIKKYFIIGMILLLCLVLCACSSSEKDSESKKDKKASSEVSENKNDDDGSNGTDNGDELSGLFGKLKESLDGQNREEDPENDNGSEGSKTDTSDSSNGGSYGGADDNNAEQGSQVDESIDLSDLSSKHGRAYVYRLTGYESYYNGEWSYSDSDGYVYDGDVKMERTLTVYRFSDHTDIEYMLASRGDWDEFWHVEYNYPAKCTYFDNVEGGTVTISGNKAVWEPEYGEFREIYTLQSTHEFDN